MDFLQQIRKRQKEIKLSNVFNFSPVTNEERNHLIKIYSLLALGTMITALSCYVDIYFMKIPRFVASIVSLICSFALASSCNYSHYNSNSVATSKKRLFYFAGISSSIGILISDYIAYPYFQKTGKWKQRAILSTGLLTEIRAEYAMQYNFDLPWSSIVFYLYYLIPRLPCLISAEETRITSILKTFRCLYARYLPVLRLGWSFYTSVENIGSEGREKKKVIYIPSPSIAPRMERKTIHMSDYCRHVHIYSSSQSPPLLKNLEQYSMRKCLCLHVSNCFSSSCLVLPNTIYLLNFLGVLNRRLKGIINRNSVGTGRRGRTYCSTVGKGPTKMDYLSQSLAQQIDNELMSEDIGYTIEQLMELAGLSISHIIFKEYNLTKFKKILICCGPGNNGGDGLVAARHLKSFGYDVTVTYPKENNKLLFKRLLQLLLHYKISVLKFITPEKMDEYDLIVDALFGFSFRGEPRKPFDELIRMMNSSKKPIVSVDVPSGTNVDTGLSTDSLSIDCEINISLMLPKEGMRNYKKKHYLGGRFIPDSIVKKYNLKLPRFEGSCYATYPFECSLVSPLFNMAKDKKAFFSSITQQVIPPTPSCRNLAVGRRSSIKFPHTFLQ
ncbi:pyridoxal 5'-phosphate synthase, putative [Plasmodium ovale curtisi]|uniref:NAD(P)H-hydrate epimerase n=1 Tax=Plasmodium ovale curtisi TaxID=864141 RepID=A0A1A8WYG2_PLAOA|nr:pyridoxal 5'-phosphate synthase, putative [Plasmodium ovale curtisi]